MTDIFRTAPENAEDVAGWVRLPSGVEIMREPFVDRPTGLYSRLSYGDLESLAKTLGAQLVSMATLVEAWKFGVRLPSVQLITGTIEEQREKTKRMMSRAFCELHDSQVRTFIPSTWDRSARGDQGLANVGKQWIRGASPGKARNGGWFSSRGIPVQPGGAGSEHHNREYTDYSQLATLERAPGISMPPARCA